MKCPHERVAIERAAFALATAGLSTRPVGKCLECGAMLSVCQADAGAPYNREEPNGWTFRRTVPA